MWCSNRRRLLIGLGAVALGGCGFRPLHGAGSGGGRRGEVRVVAPPGSDGYHYQRILRRRLGDAGPKPAYTLTTELSFNRRETAITVEEDVTRYDVLGAARYRLTPTGAAEPMLEGVANAVSGYTTLAAPYATAVAERAGRRRVAEELGRKVSDAVAIALAREADQAT